MGLAYFILLAMRHGLIKYINVKLGPKQDTDRLLEQNQLWGEDDSGNTLIKGL